MRRVDYDEIARAYDEPSRDHDVDAGLTAFLEERPSITASEVSVLDVGCGTGSSCSPIVSRCRTRTRENLGEFLTYASERHRTSHFMAMSDADYGAGVRRLEQAVITGRPGDTVASEFCLITIRGDKPR